MLSNGTAVDTKWSWISRRVREHPAERCNHRLPLFTVECFRDCFLSLRKEAAVGIDHVTD